jgi:hypothetical protein
LGLCFVFSSFLFSVFSFHGGALFRESSLFLSQWREESWCYNASKVTVQVVGPGISNPCNDKSKEVTSTALTKYTKRKKNGGNSSKICQSVTTLTVKNLP